VRGQYERPGRSLDRFQWFSCGPVRYESVCHGHHSARSMAAGATSTCRGQGDDSSSVESARSSPTIPLVRILTCLERLEAGGGVALNLVQVMRELAARGHEISVVYEHDGDLGGEFRGFCESVRRSGSTRYAGARFGEIRQVLASAWVGRETRPDLVYTHDLSELAWASTVRALTGARIVCHLHHHSEAGRVYMATAGARVSRFVTPSQSLRQIYGQEGLDVGRVDVVPNGVSVRDYPRGSDADRLRAREAFGLPVDAFVVLYLGRVIPEKGVEVLVEAWGRLGLSADRARLVVVGTLNDLDGREPEFLRGLRAGAPAGVQWFSQRRDVVSALHAADVLVLPAVWEEPFGRVIVEAMATGRPAVASAVGGVPEILAGEFERMLFPRGDVAALAERLESLIDWRRSDPGLGDRCADWVAQRYTLDRMVTALETIFTSALSRSPHPAPGSRQG
jgi:glycosyltransferase involved in cell wall biosynthesis